MLDDGSGKLQIREPRPIARRRRERAAFPARDVLDFVLRAVIAEDVVADLRDVLAAIGRKRYGS